jgi:cation transport ATPase
MLSTPHIVCQYFLHCILHVAILKKINFVIIFFSPSRTFENPRFFISYPKNSYYQLHVVCQYFQYATKTKTKTKPHTQKKQKTKNKKTKNKKQKTKNKKQKTKNKKQKTKKQKNKKTKKQKTKNKKKGYPTACIRIIFCKSIGMSSVCRFCNATLAIIDCWAFMLISLFVMLSLLHY